MGVQTATRNSRPSLWNLFSRQKKAAQKNPAASTADQEQKPFVKFGLGHALTALFAATAVPGAFATQANHVSKDGVKHLKFFDKKVDGVLSYLANFVEMIASPVLTRLDKDTVAKQDKQGLKGVVQKAFNLNFAERIANTLFTYENAFSNIFTKDVKSDSNLDVLGNFFKPITFLTSMLASAFSLPGDSAAAFGAFKGNKELFQSGSDLSAPADAFMPIASNLGSFHNALNVIKNMLSGKSYKQSKNEFGVTTAHMIQGVFGALLALPSLPAVIYRAKDLLFKDTVSLSASIANILGAFTANLQKFGHNFNLNIFKGLSAESVQRKVESLTDRISERTTAGIKNISEAVVNQSLLKSLVFKHILPVDSDGNIIFHTRDAEASGMKDSQVNKLGGIIPKVGFGKEIFKIIAPLQSALMLLPSAMTPLLDDEIQDHGILPLRMADKAIGLVSGVLALPSYAIYLMSSSMPRMITAYYDLRQKKEYAQGNVHYNAMDDLRSLVDRLMKSWIPGSKTLAKTLYTDVVNSPYGEDLFIDSDKANDYLVNYATAVAKEQEAAIKMPIILTEARNGLKMLINWKPTSKIFKASVDANNMTPAQKGKYRIHKFLTTVEHTISGIPVLGTVSSPFFKIFKKPFEVKFAKSMEEKLQAEEEAKKVTNAKNPLADMMKKIA